MVIHWLSNGYPLFNQKYIRRFLKNLLLMDKSVWKFAIKRNEELIKFVI